MTFCYIQLSRRYSMQKQGGFVFSSCVAKESVQERNRGSAATCFKWIVHKPASWDCWPLVHFHVSRSHDDRVNASLGMIKKKNPHRINCAPFNFSERGRWGVGGRKRETDRIRKSGGQTEVVIDLNSLHLSKSIIWPTPPHIVWSITQIPRSQGIR